MELHHDDIGEWAHELDLALELGAIDVGAHAVEPEEGELHSAHVFDGVVAESADGDVVLGEQDLGLVVAGRTVVG